MVRVVPGYLVGLTGCTDRQTVADVSRNVKRFRRLPDFPAKLRSLVPFYGGLSQVARDIGVSPPTLSGWCHGAAEPSLHHVAILALYFGISTDEMLCVAPRRGTEARRLGVEEQYGIWSDVRRALGFRYAMRRHLSESERTFIRERMRVAYDERRQHGQKGQAIKGQKTEGLD